MTYPGGKNGSGVPQAIINQIPPHEYFIEGFFGGGAITRLKRPAACSIGIDADAAPITNFDAATVPGLKLVHANFLKWMQDHRPMLMVRHTMLYLDPPYLFSTRKSKRPIYKHEFGTEQQHGELLEAIIPLNCRVAISGYYSDLYAELLRDWRVVTFTGMTRGGGTATEYLWMNYREPLELHDYRYLGEGYRQRQDIKRQKQRWLRNLAAMTPTKRQAMMAAIDEFKTHPLPGLPPKSGERFQGKESRRDADTVL